MILNQVLVFCIQSTSSYVYVLWMDTRTIETQLIAALYFIPQLAGMRSLIRWALIAYAAITIILYFFLDSQPFTNPLGLATKAMEIALIVLLLMDRWDA